MAGVILTDCKIFLGPYDLSGFHNQIELQYEAEMLDDTVFGTSGTRSFKPGLKRVEANGNVFWDTLQDEANFNRIGATRELLTIAPTGNTEGDPVYMVRAVNANYNPISGEVGQLLSSQFDAMSANSPLVRGQLLASGSKAATGNSVGVNLGLLGAGKKLYSSLHVTAVAATSLIVIVQSDDGAGFASPTTRITHTTFTGAGTGSDWQELVGPVATDTFWRSQWTIVGGPFTIYHTIGIM